MNINMSDKTSRQKEMKRMMQQNQLLQDQNLDKIEEEKLDDNDSEGSSNKGSKRIQASFDSQDGSSFVNDQLKDPAKYQQQFEMKKLLDKKLE